MNLGLSFKRNMTLGEAKWDLWFKKIRLFQKGRSRVELASRIFRPQLTNHVQASFVLFGTTKSA